jgi:two-component system sensor histidine kinase DegS
MNEVPGSPIEDDTIELDADNQRLREELRMVNERLLHLEIDVRARLGRELHDGAIQQVAAAGLHVNYLRRVMERAPNLMPQAIDELDDQLAKAMGSLRTVLLELRPVGMEEHGLYWMLEQYVSKFPTWGSLALELDVPPDLPRLPLNCEMAIFMIIQEAIMNVRKHAAATVVTITIRAVDDTLHFVISDNGQGFDVHAQRQQQITRGSLGLQIMPERAKQIGGTATIMSTPGRGTDVTIVVPFLA